MLNFITAALVVLGSAALATPVFAQSAGNPTQQRTTVVTQQDDQVPVFRVTVVGRTTPAVNYRHRSGATKVNFRGTPLLPESYGEAKVESKQGYIEIEVEFDELEPATRFGPEYLTYVMWAITPEGRATNLGEVLLNGSESKLNITTELQAFGLIVTAEPYFAVTQPSDVVVMENVVRKNTRGAVESVEAQYELLKRGTYMLSSNPADLPSRRLDDDVPLELYEARNAVHFARVAGADEYAESSFAKASGLLAKADEGHKKDRRRRDVISAAREAAQAAEDSRLIALERRQAEQIARDRQLTMEREAAARATAAEAMRRAELQETQRRAVEANLEAAEQQRRLAENERAEADAARLAAERAKAEAQTAIDRLAAERADAEARANAATQSAEQAERERAELRERLQQQLNIILETRESARGLIVNMSDVLFDYDRATLKPGAREKLARVAGVLLTYPGLEIEVEGHTDSMGTDEYNQGLSERRAATVRDYLVSQGIPRETIDAMGFGEARPVVGNETASGRQRNRRVELVVSGEPIDVATNRRD